MQSYNHFTLKDRECLSENLKDGKTLREIAKKLNKNVSSISREVKRNKDKYGLYCPIEATVSYINRRKKCVRRPLLSDKKIYDFVCSGLDQFWSPEAISARWELSGAKGLSFTTIYNALKNKLLVGYSLKTHLRRRGKPKKTRNYATIKPIHTIHQRPKVVELRSRLGDLEGDTVYGGIGKGVLFTFVDRKSRKLYAGCRPNRSGDTTEKAFPVILEGVKVESITLDRGPEFAKFVEIEKQLKTTIYFADPYSPWQRGSNENINGILRFFFPKGYDFKYVTDEKLQYVVNLINNRPRKCLGWLSPLEFISYKCCT
jgi:IS30 family transposase